MDGGAECRPKRTGKKEKQVMNVEQTMEVLNGAGAERLLTELYGADQVEEQRGRYRELLEGYRDKFGDGEVLTGADGDQRQPHGPQPRQGAGRQHQPGLRGRGCGEPLLEGEDREHHLRPGVYGGSE